MRHLVFVLFAPGLGLAFAACTPSGTACYPGDWAACTCDDAARGYQRCAADGVAYGACDCSGNIPGIPPTFTQADGGAATDAGGGPSKLPFLSPCTADEECETGLCYTFNARGRLCTKTCAGDGDCPAPSPGCNNQSPRVCKSG